MATIDQLIQLFTNAQNQANQANQSRLDEIMRLLEGQGESARTEARRMSAERMGAGDQSLMDRGLFNTTILDSQRRREGETLQRQLQSIGEQVALNRAGVLERVTDMGPDMGAWAQLISQLAMSQGQASGGRSYSFGGINRGGGGADSGGGGGGGGAYGGGGVGGGGRDPNDAGVTTYTNPRGQDPFANQSLEDLQAGAQANQNSNNPDQGNLPVIPRTVWFQNPAYRIQGNFVYSAQTGALVGRKGN